MIRPRQLQMHPIKWQLCGSVYAERNLGEEEHQLPRDVFPYGANFALRTDVQKQFRYETKSGRVGDQLTGDDELSVLRRIQEDGHTGIWLGDNAVEHFIPRDRISQTYVFNYFVGQGRTNIRQGKVVKTTHQALLEALYFRSLWYLKRPLFPSEQWVSHLIRAALSMGELQQLRTST